MEGAAMAKKAEENQSPAGTGDGRRSVAMVANRIESSDIFVGTKEITIGHAGEVYRLRLTALNKLILTK